jgi:predicted phage terminase large subunit-like protein
MGRDGGYLGTSVGGAITGHGAHVLLIDDPTKGRAEAMSEVIRQNVIDWYEHDAYSRLEPGGAIIIIQTRWHENDLSGYLLQKAEDDPENDQWTRVNLPALTCPTCHTFPHVAECPGGEYAAIEPERFDVPTLLRIRQNIGPQAFEAEYQQSPTLPEGNIFKREWMERRYTARWMNYQRPRDIASGKLPRWWTLQTIDTATREGVGANYSCIATWGTDGISKFLLDVWRERVDYPDLKKAVSENYFKWPADERPRLVAVEDTTHGRPLYQEMTKDQAGIPLVMLPADGTKITRAESVTGWFETGTVVLPADADWLPEWLAEHLSFPAATFDDQVDTTSMALRLITQSYEVTKQGRVKWS